MPKKQKPRCSNCGYQKLEIKKKKDCSWGKCHECNSQTFHQLKDGETTYICLASSFTKDGFNLHCHRASNNSLTKYKTCHLIPKKGINLDFEEIVDSLLNAQPLPTEKYEIREFYSNE